MFEWGAEADEATLREMHGVKRVVLRALFLAVVENIQKMCAFKAKMQLQHDVLIKTCL